MGKPTHGSRRWGYYSRLFHALAWGENIPAGQVRPKHGGRRQGFLDPRAPLSRIANGEGNDFTPDERRDASDLLNKF